MKIPEIKLTPTPETEEAKSALGYKWNEEAGYRHKLGGEADGISEADYPKCKDCGEKMTFYAKIDSIGDDFDLADCMVIHQFVCFDCFTVDSQLNQI
ncbi:hypothetical protein CSC80_16785 [Maribacter sp. 6B07]|uniref:hypothetical protein n=1 Tax=Maribacter sp. 6B07 TaxID=2045442 RepID=UPI000C06A0C7|nr:hypothetical protein [Maribacter sp. 6B07]PHN92599.1 hypothetical protein CSC80_16785 [Maribacter sp. 6B07]